MEDNKLIAEFTGSKETQRGEFDLFGTADLIEIFQEVEADDSDAKHFFTPEEMEFHKNWNWLMPVVEKIEKEGFKSTIENQWAGFDGRTDETDGLWIDSKTPCNTKLEATYKAVVEFIKRHNNNKNK